MLLFFRIALLIKIQSTVIIGKSQNPCISILLGLKLSNIEVMKSVLVFGLILVISVAVQAGPGGNAEKRKVRQQLKNCNEAAPLAGCSTKVRICDKNDLPEITCDVSIITDCPFKSAGNRYTVLGNHDQLDLPEMQERWHHHRHLQVYLYGAKLYLCTQYVIK